MANRPIKSQNFSCDDFGMLIIIYHFRAEASNLGSPPLIPLCSWGVGVRYERCQWFKSYEGLMHRGMTYDSAINHGIRIGSFESASALRFCEFCGGDKIFSLSKALTLRDRSRFRRIEQGRSDGSPLHSRIWGST